MKTSSTPVDQILVGPKESVSLKFLQNRSTSLLNMGFIQKNVITSGYYLVNSFTIYLWRFISK